MTTPAEGHACSKPWCRAVIPLPSDPEAKVYRACARCRAQDQANTVARRKKRKLEEMRGQPFAQRVQTDFTNPHAGAEPLPQLVRTDATNWQTDATDLQTGVSTGSGTGAVDLGVLEDAGVPKADTHADPDGEDGDSDTDDKTVDMVCAKTSRILRELTLMKPMNYKTNQELFNKLREVMKDQEKVDFTGRYEIDEDHLVSAKERTEMVTHDVWRVTGYRFTYVAHLEQERPLKEVSSESGTIRDSKAATRHEPGVVRTNVARRKRNRAQDPLSFIGTTWGWSGMSARVASS
jgi:hypothetical protein